MFLGDTVYIQKSVQYFELMHAVSEVKTSNKAVANELCNS